MVKSNNINVNNKKSITMPLTKSSGITISFNDYQSLALIDTGSTASIISNELYVKLTKVKGVIIGPPQKTEVAAMTASSTPISFHTRVNVHFKINYLSWTMPFLIAKSLPVSIILGIDFLKNTKAILNIAQKSLTFPYQHALTIVLSDPTQGDIDVDNRLEQLGPKLGPQLNDEETCQVNKLLSEFPNTITKRLGQTNLIKYHINIKPDHKVRCRPYQFAPPKTEQLRQHIRELLDNGVIRESNSQYASPAFLVPKKGGKTRMVVNFKALNQGLTLEATPMPTVESAFQHLGKAKWFTVLDLNSAYNQIPLDEQSKQYTAFVVPWAQYEYNYVPFGLANGSMVLTDLINRIFGDIRYRYLYSFFDDIVVYTDSGLTDHLSKVSEVLHRLQQAGLTVNPEKMVVATDRIEFLGHVIHNNTLSLSEEHTRPINEFPKPKNLKQLSRFLGMAAFYSRFIRNFSEISAPLNQLKKKMYLLFGVTNKIKLLINSS